MAGAKLIGATAVVVCAAAAWLFLGARETHVVYEPPVKQIEPASPCPWRDAEQDMMNWFPGATKYTTHDVILSGQRTELQQKLGRMLQPEEMALHTYLVARNDQQVGTVLTRRVKGDHGAIEFVLGLDSEEKIRDFKIQRIREPEEVVHELEALDLRERVLKLNSSNISLRNIGTARSPAEKLATNILGEVRALLVLFETGQTNLQQRHH